MGRVTKFLKASGRRGPELDHTNKSNAAAAPVDKGLQRVVTSWPALPRHIRSAILALVDSQGSVRAE